MKTNAPSKKSGSILAIVMVITVAFTLIVAALLQLASFNERETIQQLRTTQAHWIAEAGLERALSWVLASEDYREDLDSEWSNSFDGNLETGDYKIIAKTTNSNGIVIQSTGTTTTNGGISESVTVQVSLEYIGGIPGALVGLHTPGHTDLGKDVEVWNGDVFRNGTMEIKGTLDPNHVAHATEDGSPYGTGNYTQGYIPAPDPPVIDSDGSLAQLLLDAVGHTNNTFTGGALVGTVYVDDDVTVTGDITGSGTLVVTGDLNFNGNKLDVSDGVEIVVDKNITVSTHTSFGDDVLIFSQYGNISLNHNVDGGTVAVIAKNGSLGHITTDYNNSLGSIDTGHLLSSGHTIGDIKDNKPSFSGILYAGYDIILSMKADIHGTIISGRHMDLGKDTGNIMRVTFDPSVLSGGWPINFGNEIVSSNLVWQVVRQ